MFSKRHYAFLANWLKSQLPDGIAINSAGRHYHKVYAHDLARKLDADNPRFNRTKFLVACGIHEDEIWPED